MRQKTRTCFIAGVSEPDGVLSAPNVLEYTYTRTTGPVIGRFMTGLRDHKMIEGIRTGDGRVIVPPLEYDPDSGEPTGDFVVVANVGTAVSSRGTRQLQWDALFRAM